MFSKIITLAIATTMMASATVTEASAHDNRQNNNDGAAIAFSIIAGAMLGAALNNKGHHHGQPRRIIRQAPAYYGQPAYGQPRRRNCFPVVVGTHYDRRGGMHNITQMRCN